MNVKKLFDLSNKIVIITGSSGFLGSQFAEGFSQNGADVVLADINYSKSKKMEKTLKLKYNVNPLAVKLDVTNKKSIKKMITMTLKKFSKIDVLINNAFFYEGKKGRSVSFEKFPLSIWNQALDVNLTGPFLCSQEVGAIMVKQKHGIIINISSIYGLVGADQRTYEKGGNRSTSVYATTKGGVLNFTRYLAAYWNNTGVRINSVSFGGIMENQDPSFIKNYSKKTMLGRMARKDEYVGALIFLASDASSYMTGANLVVDGGWTAW